MTDPNKQLDDREISDAEDPSLESDIPPDVDPIRPSTAEPKDDDESGHETGDVPDDMLVEADWQVSQSRPVPPSLKPDSDTPSPLVTVPTGPLIPPSQPQPMACPPAYPQTASPQQKRVRPRRHRGYDDSPRLRGPYIHRTWFVLALTYGSVMTILFVRAYQQNQELRDPEPHHLESLPDFKRLDEGTLKLVPEEAELPPGHTLNLRESQTFGYVRVTPLQVTRGMLHFDAPTDNPRGVRASIGPVLKLWLRFDNVSTDQVIPPLDRELRMRRTQNDQNPSRMRANNFVNRVEDRTNRGHRVMMFRPMTQNWKETEWTIQGLEAERSLQPGESFETFLPTTEVGLEKLTGPLVWRFHFRKGFNPQSGNGVTTLAEVVFHSNDIIDEGAVRSW